MKQTMLRTLTVACAVAFAGSAYAADDITKCGAAQLKAFGGLFSNIFKEASRACAQAATDDAATVEAEVSVDKVTSFTGKFNAAVTKTETTFGDANCFINDSGGEAITVADVLSTTTDAASDLCSSDGSNP
jgi:hypothetical protein